jgi:hypothetical protein
MEKREKLITALLKSFLNDLSASSKPLTQEETLAFIGILVEYLKGVYNHEPSMPEYNYDGSPFDEEEFIENNLLKPYRDKMVPFIKTRLSYYFAKDEYKKTQLFQKLNIEEPLLNKEEYEEYILRIYSVLANIKTNLYLRPIESTSESSAEAKKLLDNPEEMEKQGFKVKNKDYTRSRQILLYYFMLKLIGVTRLDANAINLAEFGHVLFYWPVEITKNNDVYKKLCKAPYIQDSDKENLKDLEYVKRQFENIGHTQGIALVQKEIDSLKR